MYEFWYDYVKPNYGEKAKLCFMVTDIFSVYIKIDDIYKDIAEDFETGFDTSNHELDRPLPKVKSKKVIEINERWTTWKNCKICWTKGKNL